jgi:hypothetical protein
MGSNPSQGMDIYPVVIIVEIAYSWGQRDSLISEFFFLRILIEVTVTAKVLLSQKRREKEDRIGESQPFPERILFVENNIGLERESNPRPRII